MHKISAHRYAAPAMHKAMTPKWIAEMMMTRDELLTRLSQLLPSQFEAVLFQAKIPMEHLPGSGAPQATRAIDVIRYFELRNQLEQLTSTLEEIVEPSGSKSRHQALTDPR
jgi:hypothetical protein